MLLQLQIHSYGTAINKPVLFISNKERLIRMVCGELWVCSRGKVYCLEGGFDKYGEIVEQEVIIS